MAESCRSEIHGSITLCWFPPAGQERKYEVRKRRVLRGKSVPHYAAVAPRGEGLMLAAEKPFVFTHVDGRPVEEPPPPSELNELEKAGGSKVGLGQRSDWVQVTTLPALFSLKLLFFLILSEKQN